MALVNHAVTNLINGVSEQAPSVRLDNQVEEQINCFSDVTRGLTKRNGLELNQITQIDIEDTFKIEFTLDGIRHMIALDANNAVTPVQYVPLSADVDALAVAITESQYFKEMSRNDLQIIEDKDKVYLLNRKQIVGGASSRQTYFDIKLIRQDNFTTPTTWDAGEYTITIDGVADPDYVPLQTAVGQVVVTVDRSTTLQNIADAINADIDLIAETGLCTVSGTISNYRISFNSIPTGFVAPSTVTLETVAITEGFDTVEDSGWLFNTGVPTYQVAQYPVGNTQGSAWVWAGSIIGNTDRNATTFSQGGYTYYRGEQKISGSINSYSIKRYRVLNQLYSFDVETTSPSTQGGSEGQDSNKAMTWITGVSSNQTYDLTINYYDITAPETNIPVSISTVSVGTTASNIKLNWVAGQIQSKTNAFTHFNSVQYDNAVLITAIAGYGITSVDVTNNYDTSSINSVVEAVEMNESGLKDITNLPPQFADDFKVRVSVADDDKSNYYLTYSTDFKGWKEGGLDESRFLDHTTMPYIIDKTKTKENGIILIEPATWNQVLAGDVESNKDPSFVGRTINDMFFYGSRLGFATDDTLVMSGIDDPETFFRTTTSQVRQADRVDIKLDSSKIGYDPIKHVITYDGKLFINTGSNQSVLLVNTAFDLTSARLSEVSSYSLGNNKPMPVGNGLYFANTTRGVTNIYNYVPTGNNNYTAIEMTKHMPRYLQGQFKSMAYSSDVTVVSTFDDKRTLYIQNRYTQEGQMIQNAWHKWTVPYDVEHFYFYDNVLYIIMSSVDSGGVDKYTIVTQYNLRPQDVVEVDNEVYIGWRPLLDCYTKDKTLIENFSEFSGVNDLNGQSFDTVTEAYDSTERNQDDLGITDGPYFEKDSSPLYYWKVDGNTNTVVFNDGSEIVFGNNTLTEFDDGGYRYFKGETDDGTGHFEVSRATVTPVTYHLDEMLYGINFNSYIKLSEIVPRQINSQGVSTTMSFATLMVRRMRLLLNKSGIFNVTVTFEDRKGFTTKYTGQPLGKLVIGRGTVSDINFKFPINGKSDKISIEISTVDSTPFNLLSTEYQGQLIIKGRSI